MKTFRNVAPKIGVSVCMCASAICVCVSWGECVWEYEWQCACVVWVAVCMVCSGEFGSQKTNMYYQELHLQVKRPLFKTKLLLQKETCCVHKIESMNKKVWNT